MMHGGRFSAHAGGLAAAQKNPVEESITASATFNRTPQVAIVSSNFRGGGDHEGTKIEGLRDPVAVDRELSEPQVRAMVEKAISLGGIRGAGLAGIIDEGDALLASIITALALEMPFMNCGGPSSARRLATDLDLGSCWPPTR